MRSQIIKAYDLCGIVGLLNICRCITVKRTVSFGAIVHLQGTFLFGNGLDSEGETSVQKF